MKITATEDHGAWRKGRTLDVDEGQAQRLLTTGKFKKATKAKSKKESD